MKYEGNAGKIKDISISELEKAIARCLHELTNERLLVSITSQGFTPPHVASALFGHGPKVELQLTLSSSPIEKSGTTSTDESLPF
jgi:hypothetical protein